MTVKLYKLTRDGCSPHTGYEWSLPTRSAPGGWHTVDAGPLVPHKNAFHLTSKPKAHWSAGLEVWEVEAVGTKRLVNCSEAEYIARKVRFVRRLTPRELDALDVGVERTYRTSHRAGVRRRVPKGMSPVMQVLTVVRDHALTAGNRRGDNMFAYVMRRLFDVVVEARMDFAPADFAEIAKLGGLGVGSEAVYAALVQSGNASALKAWEAWQGRTPWMWQGRRLYVGAPLRWRGRECKVTAIDDATGTIRACAYHQRQYNDRGYPIDDLRVSQRHRITKAALADADKAQKLADAWLEKSAALAKLIYGKQTSRPRRHRSAAHAAFWMGDHAIMIAMWSAEERAEAEEWARLRDADRGKTRVRVAAPPVCVLATADAIKLHKDAETAASRAFGDALAARGTSAASPVYEPVTGTPVCAASEALGRWAEAACAGFPAQHLAPSTKVPARKARAA